MAKLRRASSRTDRPLGHPTQLPRGDLDRLVGYRRTISPNTATPTVKITNSKSAILNSRLVLMSGHTALARANSTRSHLFLNLATDSPRADSQRPVRHVQPNDSDRVPARWTSYRPPVITSIFVRSNSHATKQRTCRKCRSEPGCTPWRLNSISISVWPRDSFLRNFRNLRELYR